MIRRPRHPRRSSTARVAVVLVATAALTLTACNDPNKSVSSDQKVTNSQLQTYQQNQPVPRSNYSEYRQTVINVEEAEIHGTATTTFFYNQGSSTPIKSCPSIGYPVAADAQLTNPSQVVRADVGGGNYVDGVVGQQEPNGVYSSSSTTGTYVVCVGAGGVKRIDYWEGYVETEGGQATIGPDGKINDAGASTVTQAHK